MFEIPIIKQDIIELDEESLLKKYLLSTDVWYFSEYHKLGPSDLIFNLDKVYEIISKNLAISMKNILIIGSSKIGCSLAPHKILRVFDSDKTKESDIDIAIISDKYYLEFWNIARNSVSVKYTKYYSEIAEGIFNGFISKNTVDDVPEIRKIWNDKIGLTRRELQEETCIQHPINFRIYRSWEDLENYHKKGFKKIKKIIRE
ncbi:hypothetical protein [Fusibacter bizertensis]